MLPIDNRSVPERFEAGDHVHTPLGKGVVREVRNSGRVMVDVGGRSLVLAEDQLTPIEPAKVRARQPARLEAADLTGPAAGVSEVDLHGLTVDEALGHIDRELNAALLRGDAQLRFIHGRSGGRIRGALHARLKAIPSIRGFRLDPRNAGVTIVNL